MLLKQSFYIRNGCVSLGAGPVLPDTAYRKRKSRSFTCDFLAKGLEGRNVTSNEDLLSSVCNGEYPTTLQTFADAFLSDIEDACVEKPVDMQERKTSLRKRRLEFELTDTDESTAASINVRDVLDAIDRPTKMFNCRVVDSIERPTAKIVYSAVFRPTLFTGGDKLQYYYKP